MPQGRKLSYVKDSRIENSDQVLFSRLRLCPLSTHFKSETKIKQNVCISATAGAKKEAKAFFFSICDVFVYFLTLYYI